MDLQGKAEAMIQELLKVLKTTREQLYMEHTNHLNAVLSKRSNPIPDDPNCPACVALVEADALLKVANR